jgi:hypothetical protein
LLPQVIRQILADDTRDDVVEAARRKRDDPKIAVAGFELGVVSA